MCFILLDDLTVMPIGIGGVKRRNRYDTRFVAFEFTILFNHNIPVFVFNQQEMTQISPSCNRGFNLIYREISQVLKCKIFFPFVPQGQGSLVDNRCKTEKLILEL